MITITAEVHTSIKNKNAFVIGKSKIGDGSTIGERLPVVEVIGRRNLINFTNKEKYRSNDKKPCFGIFSNSGTFSFKDNGVFAPLISNGDLTSGDLISFYINNTLVENARQPIGKVYSSKWKYDKANNEVTVSVKDDLQEWQNIQVEGFFFNLHNPSSKTAKDFYLYLYNKTPSKYNMLNFENLDIETQSILSNTIIQKPFIYSDNLWKQWEKLCKLCMLYICKDNVGNTICKYVGW